VDHHQTVGRERRDRKQQQVVDPAPHRGVHRFTFLVSGFMLRATSRRET
jgi:hypothetical protein